MNPALENYYQQMSPEQGYQEEQEYIGGQEDQAYPQEAQPQYQPEPEPSYQQQPMAQAAPAPYNPFDVGINRAIESARDSLGMTEKQQDKALRGSILNFASNISQMPREKGFFNNFGSAARAAVPALQEYDKLESGFENENNALANQMLGYQRQQEQDSYNRDGVDWQRDMRERQFASQEDQRNISNDFRERSLEQQNLPPEAKKESMPLNKIIQLSEQLINKAGDKTQVGRGSNLLNKVLPGGNMQMSEDQASLHTLGEMLRGKLYSVLNYRSTGEFEHIPTISPNNSPEANMAILKQLTSLFPPEALMGQKSELTDTNTEYRGDANIPPAPPQIDFDQSYFKPTG
jgi:hypothetical protein